jgi:hypothetical protein
MLAVTASARVSAVPPKEEDTLSRRLGTPPLLETHSPVGYCWQNSRCCRPLRGPQHSHIGDFVSHPNDQAQQPSPRRRAMSRGNQHRGPGLLQRIVGCSLVTQFSASWPVSSNGYFPTKVRKVPRSWPSVSGLAFGPPCFSIDRLGDGTEPHRHPPKLCHVSRHAALVS